MPRKRASMPEDFNGSFPARLRQIMAEQGKTQQDVATAIEKTRQAVGYYADGSSSPDWKTIAELAKYFSVTSDWLLGLTEYRKSESTQIFAADLGLSEQAIEVLRLWNEQYQGKYLIPTISLLIEQETPPPDSFSIVITPEMSEDEQNELAQEAERAFEEEYEAWEKNKYIPIIEYIESFLSIERNPEKKYDITESEILPKKQGSGFNAIRLNSIRTISASDITERILLSDIEDGLKKLKERQSPTD